MNTGDKMENNFSTYMIHLRKEQELSQEAFAKKLNLTLNTVKKWENGEEIPTKEIIKKISDTFDVSNKMLLDLATQSKKDIQKTPLGFRSFVLANVYLFAMIVSLVLLVLLCFQPNKSALWIIIFAVLSAVFIFLFTISRTHSRILLYQNQHGIYLKNDLFIAYDEIQACYTKESKGIHLLYASSGYLIIQTKDQTYEIGPMKQVESICSEIMALKNKQNKQSNYFDYFD